MDTTSQIYYLKFLLQSLIQTAKALSQCILLFLWCCKAHCALHWYLFLKVTMVSRNWKVLQSATDKRYKALKQINPEVKTRLIPTPQHTQEMIIALAQSLKNVLAELNICQSKKMGFWHLIKDRQVTKNIDCVAECSGIFNKREKLLHHISAGAKKVYRWVLCCYV